MKLGTSQLVPHANSYQFIKTSRIKFLSQLVPVPTRTNSTNCWSQLVPVTNSYQIFQSTRTCGLWAKIFVVFIDLRME